MDKCVWCGSGRLASVSAKVSDLFSASAGGHDHDGYVPGDMGIGGGDYIEFTYCLSCMQIQVDPVPETWLETGKKGSRP